MSESGKGRSWLVLIFVVAAAARLAGIWWFGPTRLGGDEMEYVALARGLVETGRYASAPGFSPLIYSTQPGAFTAFRPPLWPFVLSGLFRLFGYSPMAARVALALGAAAGCLLLAVLVDRLFADRAAAGATGLLAALWPASIWYPGTRSTTLGAECLAGLLLIAALLALTPGRVRPPTSALLAGALFGACALTRSNLALLLPLAAAWTLGFGEGSARVRGARALLMLAGGLVIMAPWMLRNRERLGWFTIATQREPLFIGNNAWARGSYDSEFLNDRRSAQLRWLQERHPGFLELTEVEKSRIYAEEAVSYAREHPARQAWLIGRRLVLFASPLRETEQSDNAYDWAFGTVLGVCLVGVALLRREVAALSLLALPVAASLATVALVMFLPRYRYTAEPMMVAFACRTVAQVARQFGMAPAGWALGLFLALNLAVAAAFW